MENRKQRIVVNDAVSKQFPLPWGVPQGSVMEYILAHCVVRFLPIADIQYAMYADDTQLYVVMSPNNHDECLQKLSKCISNIMAWSSSNKLKLNQSKTEILHFTSQFRNSSPLPSLNVAGVDIIPSNVVRNLGVRLDNKLNMKQHINNTCRAAAFGISKIGKLRKYLNKQSTERLKETSGRFVDFPIWKYIN